MSRDAESLAKAQHQRHQPYWRDVRVLGSFDLFLRAKIKRGLVVLTRPPLVISKIVLVLCIFILDF